MPLLTTGAGRFPVIGGGGGDGAAYVYRGASNTLVVEDYGTVHSAAIDLGAAVADRRVIVEVDGQVDGIDVVSIEVNGVPLTRRPDGFDNSSNTVAVYDGIVDTGDGTNSGAYPDGNVVVTWDTGSFLDRSMFVWTATGLTTGYVTAGTHQGTGTGSIGVNEDDFVFAIQRQGSPSGDWSGSSPTLGAYRPVGTASTSADFTADATGTFTLDPGGGGQANMAFAVYR